MNQSTRRGAALDPRTPVLVGAAAVDQKIDDPRQAREPIELMIEALEGAAADAGSRELLARADSIRVPRGFWDYADPGRIVADRLGAAEVRTQVSEIGVLQTTLLGTAAADIASGAADVVLIAGGEARYRAMRAQKLGVDAPLTAQAAGVEPDRVLRPDRDVLHEAEMRNGLLMPVTQYSVVDNALRYADGQSVAEHRDSVAALWAAFSRVAAENPNAWIREAIGAEEIRGSGDSNRMLAFPYTKRHTSQWNVDQAAGLILCSVGTARAHGVAEDRWVFPHAVADANHMLTLCERAHLCRSPGFAAAGRRALRHAGIDIAEIDHLELYSCFPAAVRVQARELRVPADRPLTVTGGMSFAGGPLNNFVLQGICRMVALLREGPETTGLVTAVSGIITKQGVSVWSCRPPRNGFRYADVSEEARRDTEVVEVVGGEGRATIASYTVLYESGEPARAVALCDLESGQRAVAKIGNSGFSVAVSEEELCGRRVSLKEGVCDL